MRSVRFDKELEARLEDEARATRQSASEIIRRAVDKHLHRKPRKALSVADRLRDIIGVASSAKVPGERKSKDFGDLLVERHEEELRRWMRARARAAKRRG